VEALDVMKKLPGFKTLCLMASAFLAMSAGGAYAQQPAEQQTAPQQPAPQQPAAQQAPAASPQTVTLDQAVAAARATAPGLKLATITVDTARTALIQTQATNGLSLGAKGDYFHQGTLLGSSTSTSAGAAAAGASGSGSNGENVQGGVTLSGPSTNLGLTALHTFGEGVPGDQVSSASLSASQTVFDGYPGGRAAAAVQQADYSYRAAQVSYDASLKSVLYQVKQAYYTLLGDQDTLRIRQATVSQSEQNLAYYKGLFTAGRATQLDVLQNQVTLTQAQLDLRSAQNTVDVDRKNLSAAVGWPLDKQYTVAEAPMPDLPSLAPEDALKAAFQNRPELRTLELNLASADVNLALQKSQTLPVVSVNGSLGMSQDWSANINAGSFTAGASIALPVLDGGLRNSQVRQAADQIASYKVQQDQQRQSITIAVQNALFGVRDAHDRLDLSGQSVKAAQGQYDLQKARYAVGLVTTLDVLTAFQAFTTAQVGLEQAKSSYVLALLNLDSAMGL
jgi:outer membrane protein